MKVAILQSNYIPWKGYFDLIAAVDHFIIYDDVQFTKNDWRNRNKIKTSQGVQWLTVPVGQDIKRRIRDVVLPNSQWQIKHWKTLESNYSRAQYFDEIADIFQPLYQHDYSSLSALNRVFIEAVCSYLSIPTRISDSSDFVLEDGKTDRLVSLCSQVQATEYISGPAAKNYIDQALFSAQGIQLTWFDYEGYPEYPQCWGGFVHEVSILDLLFNCGNKSANYMRYVNR